ncbi:MAG: RNA-binding protein [Salinivirgaceae bacterium]|jgi:RNA recognition motif-containing protein|nr:RNA-binding protein [Salinivirgaceae bacterium]
MKLYIGNLDEKIQSHHLKEAFQEYGAVKTAIIVNDKKTGVSRGFGFIEMPNDDEAQKVIDSVNGGTWEGKVITIRKAY